MNKVVFDQLQKDISQSLADLSEDVKDIHSSKALYYFLQAVEAKAEGYKAAFQKYYNTSNINPLKNV